MIFMQTKSFLRFGVTNMKPFHIKEINWHFAILIVAQKILKIKIRITMICLRRNKAVGLSLTLLNKTLEINTYTCH